MAEKSAGDLGSIVGIVGGILGIVAIVFGAYVFLTNQFASKADIEAMRRDLAPKAEVETLREQTQRLAATTTALTERLEKVEQLARTTVGKADDLSRSFEELKAGSSAALNETGRIRSALANRRIVFAMEDCISGGTSGATCSACCADAGGAKCIENCSSDPSVAGPWCVCATNP